MAASNVAMQVDTKQQEAIVKYVRNCVETLADTWNLRNQFLLRDQFYYREIDFSIEQSRAKAANISGDPYKLQNLTMPVVMPQVESALAYQASVFLTGYPIFGVVSNPQNADAALQMETVIGDNSVRFGWPRHMIMWMRDALKFNFAPIEITWERKKIYSVINDPAANLKQGQEQEIFYEGNSLKRLDPYNTIWDKRVFNPSELHAKGEFAGYIEIMGRVQLKQMLLDLDTTKTMNAKKAFESGTPSVTLNGSDSWYYVPMVNPTSFVGTNVLPTTNWLAWAMIDGNTGKPGGGINYNNIYEVCTLYARIIPTDFRLSVPKRGQPQIWKFIVVNRDHLVYCERQTNAHNWLPILFCQPIEDGLGYQTKSFLDNAVPYQAISTSLWNSVLEGKRRQLYDRLLYDPSRVRKEDIDRVSSVARVPVKQSAYGRPVSDAVYQLPYREDNLADTVAMSEKIEAMADVANGQNRVQRGQFQKGNKTKTEFNETMGNSNARQQLMAMGIEYQAMVPLKEMIKLNILQYQQGAEYFSISAKAAVPIKPEELRKNAMVFRISDGLLPTEKLMSSDILQVFMQTLQTSPLMQSQYDIVGAFTYWCKMQGAQWMEDFKRNPAEAAKIMQQLTTLDAAGKSPAARPQNAEGV